MNKFIVSAEMMTDAEVNEQLAGTTGLPSIFDLIANDRLSISIQQAFRHIVKVKRFFISFQAFRLFSAAIISNSSLDAINY